MVTEYFNNGTLEDHLLEYKGKPALALRAFRSVVSTVSLLPKEGIVHRDIKPANIFVRGNHELVLGDFGLVFVPDRMPRITASHETVGAGDFIPPWGDMGARLEHVDRASTYTCSARFSGAWYLEGRCSKGSILLSPRTT